MATTRFFVSYTGADSAWAEWIAWQLEAAGYTVTVQAWDSRPGNDFVAWMDRAIRDADRVVVVLSPAYEQAASFVVPEWTAALGRDPTGELGLLVPVRVVEFIPGGLWRTRGWIDLVGKDRRAAVDALLAGMKQERMKPAKEPAFPGGQPPEPAFPGGQPAKPSFPEGSPSPLSSGTAQHRLPPPGDLARDLYRGELKQAERLHKRPFWWPWQAEVRWMGDLFAFWTKVPGFNAREVVISADQPAIGRSSYPSIPDDFDYPANTPGRQKVAFASMSEFHTDGAKTLHVAPVEYGMVRFLETRWADFQPGNPDGSVFGVTGWRPVPSLLVAHSVVITQDGWVLLARRSADRHYFPGAWSASFEEQVDIGPADRGTGDRTIFDTVARGLAEEFDLPSPSIESVRVLSVGRECYQSDRRLVLNAAVICGVVLDSPLQELWAHLSDTTAAIDRSEHDAWVGLRPIPPHRLDEVVPLTQGERDFYLPDLERSGFELRVLGSLPIDDKPLTWHPTSSARLSLCSALLERLH